MKAERMIRALNQIDADYIAEAAPAEKKSKKQRILRLSMIAACLVLAATLSISAIVNRQHTLSLSDASSGVTAKYTQKAPRIDAAASLIPLTENELFTHFDTAVLKGTVTKIDNIVLDFNGEKTYRAIAQIQVEKVWRGACQEGEPVSVLVPCPIESGVWVEDTETVSALRVGMTGIFMPVIYDADDFHEENGARLALRDIAPYGFADGSRYAFLETENGLIFARWAYESISDVQTLAEIEIYVSEMVEKSK